MKRLLDISVIILVAFMASCSDNEKFIVAASKVASQCGASKYSVTTFSAMGSEKSLKFTFTDPHMPGITQPDGITSMAALGLFRETGDNELKDYNEITIELETETVFTKTYQIGKLRIANDQITDLAKFFRATRSDDSTALNDFFDKRIFPDSLCYLLYHSIKKAEREYGTLKDVQFLGFSFAELEESNEPVLAIKSSIMQGTKKCVYIFYILERTGKIAAIHLKA